MGYIAIYFFPFFFLDDALHFAKFNCDIQLFRRPGRLQSEVRRWRVSRSNSVLNNISDMFNLSS